ncbi:MAG: insulinase family protein [Candidatus Obscuribacterales bacterium]|nr:insulinase family protein [Candidatus Obscuribacterales bacterium]
MVNAVNQSPAGLQDLGIQKIAEVKGVTEYRLSNGLKILLMENHTAPVITFLVLYKVGSRNEGVGFTGATHFLEHMLFKGTKKHNPDKGNGIDDHLTQIGAYWNATTWFDRTSYFEVVPSEFLDMCVKLEADRMRNLMLRQSDRDSEMSVVRNELERGENYPEEALEKELYAVAFREHPYHHPTIGWRSDVEGVALERLRKFYDTFYWPNNATVVLLGDYDPDAALRMIHKHYGAIKASPEPIPQVYTTEPPQEGERRFEIVRAGDLPKVWLGFHVSEADHEDTYPLAAARHILGSSFERSSRLYKALIDTGIAAEAFCRHDELRDPGLFIVGATLNPGVGVEKAEEALLEELRKLGSEPVSEDELSRAKSSNSKGTILAKADPSSMAFMLGEAESKADWYWLMEYDDHFEAVTADDIMRVCAKYFVRSNRTIGQFKPLQYVQDSIAAPAPAYEASEDDFEEEVPGQLPPGFKEPEVKTRTISDMSSTFTKDELYALLVEAPKSVKVKMSKSSATGKTFVERVHREVLPNGLTVLLMENPGTESIGFALNLRAGRYFTYKEEPSLSELVGEMLPRGSKRFSKTKIAELLEGMGIPGGLEFGVDNYRLSLATNLVTSDFKTYLELLDDVVRNPLMDEEELRKVRVEWTARLVEGANNTRSVAWNGLKRIMYPSEHPFFEKTFAEQIEELAHVNSAQLLEAHGRLVSPQMGVISVVGDIRIDEALALIKERFGNWEGPKPGTISIPSVPLADARNYYQIELADKSSVDVILSHPIELKRSNRDFYAARMANAALGQDTITSRLGQVVRDRAGLTYGIYSVFSDTAFGGAPWSVMLTVNPKNIDKGLYLVDKVLDEYMTRGISSEELSREVGRAVGSFKVGLASSMGIARVLAELEFLGLGITELDEISGKYLSVTKSQADEAMRKYFHPAKAVAMIAGTLS